MSAPFVGEIRTVGFNFAPLGWALCNGQLLPISQNVALFSILGTYYGGDGISTFGLPNLQGAGPIGAGQGPGLSQFDLGETGGATAVTLIQAEIPDHTHAINAVSGSGTQNSPAGGVLATAHYGRALDQQYGPTSATPVAMSPTALAVAGGNLPHNNLPPYLVVNFIIALQGVFPPRD
jgi:microcystin-dependent protein